MGSYFTYDFPIGPLTIGEEEGFITYLNFDDQEIKNYEKCETNVLKDANRQLHEYFSGTRKVFNLPLKYLSGTPFQQEVWDALQEIPYGITVSYKDIASKIKRPKAVRAVGGANNKNYIPIIIPCHRVIGANGKLVGYGGGLDKKVFLLELERKH